MTNPPSAPDAPARSAPAVSGAGVWLATGFGLGYVPTAPGTAGSLASALVFALLHRWLEGAALQLAYLLVLAWLVPLALWSTEQALRRWRLADPPAVVIDEILGQWMACGGLVLASGVELPALSAGAEWKYLLAGLILFRAFDVVKPFPIRRSERLPGAAGVVVDDMVAGLYAGGGLLLLAWTRWLN